MPTGVPSPRPERPVGHRLADVATFVQVPVPAAGGDVVVTGLAQDSRQVRPGDVYLARPGVHTHGAEYAGQAAKAGAAAAVTDAAGRGRCEAAGLPTLVVEDPAAVLGSLSAWIFGEPARALRLLGVTGTNGKTTTTYLLEAALAGSGHRTGLVGTVESRIGEQVLPSAHTTPEAPDLQALLALMREQGVDAAVMEVSSHALALGRVSGTTFEVAGFTNLSQDHLELHGDLEAYYQAKAALFTPDLARQGVINVDDPYGRRLAGEARVPVVTVSPSGLDQDADWRVLEIHGTDGGGSAFRIAGPRGISFHGEIGLPGTFNVANAALALAMLDAAGFDAPELAPALASAVVPGRMERFGGPGGVTAVVDYAHTPAAIEVALQAVRPTANRLIAVFGCGGDRDREKRPLMGEVAARLADLVVVTDDNPRSEDPAAIRAAAVEGAARVPEADRAEVREIGGRRDAIAWALGRARPGDVVMVLGKGHEQGQEIAGVRHPFDDRAVVRDLLAKEGMC